MTDAEMLASVKSALGIEGTYQDNTITEYINEVELFLIGAGVPKNRITAGVVSRGVSDLWNYEFPLEQIKEIDSLSYQKGRKQGD